MKPKTFTSLRSQISALIFLLVPISAHAQSDAITFVPIVPDSCARFPAGSVVHNPPALFSRNGSLAVNFSYQTRTDADGRILFAFMTPEGFEKPDASPSSGRSSDHQ